MDLLTVDAQFLTPISSSPKNKRSPSRRAKSRWEPIQEEKVVDKSANFSYETVKYGGWNKQFSAGKSENKENTLSTKFSFPEQKALNKNATRPAKRQRLSNGLNAAVDGETSSDSDKEQSLTAYYSAAVALADSPEEKKRRENRSKRFEKGRGSRPVKGTCQEIEKRYLRLTSAPDPATVRPEEVLEKALIMVQNSEKNYLYKCDQLKSIRQDLTVQHIRNELTAKVYETHARLAIEVGDLPEYNQCQSQLSTLYLEGIKGSHMEFAAYNLLCVLLHSSNNRDLLSAMSRLSAEAKKNEAVKHALSVRLAMSSGNYVMFFRLYKTAPNLNSCLMDLHAEKMRYAAIRCMSRSYRPTVPVSYIAQILGFANLLLTTEASDEKDVDGVEECVEWLKAHGGCLTFDNSGEMLLDTKASASSLYMPEPEDAVAHGDASLAVNDFLTRSLA
ncbi:SAC3/GANP/Nin1/mts3/eIF-3 p25 family [Forsythia ovata]|uniref:SAC3/GANP/Nin1/mts3/eIF-3 p25 family n=1 Tax=Forsythia ovata TaxID=205694 RepID=A0ABD1WHL0_9LAMI